MSTIRELARDSVKIDRKGSFAVRVSIFIAVVLVGFFLIIFSLIDYGQWNTRQRQEATQPCSCHEP